MVASSISEAVATQVRSELLVVLVLEIITLSEGRLFSIVTAAELVTLAPWSSVAVTVQVTTSSGCTNVDVKAMIDELPMVVPWVVLVHA